MLLLNNRNKTLSLISKGRIVVQQHLLPNELELVAELLEVAPSYCPYELALSTLTRYPPDLCHILIQQAREAEGMGGVMQPVCAVLIQCQQKLHLLGVQIISLHETGYLLTPSALEL